MGERAKVLAQEIRELSEEVHRFRSVAGTVRQRSTTRLLMDFDGIAERLEFLKYDGATRIVRSARAAYAEMEKAQSRDTVNYLTGKVTEMLNEAASWVTDDGD